MNIAEFKEYVQMTPPHHPIAVIGKHGIGKSEIVSQIASEQLHMPMVSIMVGQVSDSVDLLGLPNRIQAEFIYQDEKGQQEKKTDWVTKFTLPDFFPTDLTKPIVLFLDECNRTESPSVFSCLLDLVLNQSIQGRKLPKGSRILAAWNPWTEENYYRVSELCREPAFVSRFAEVILEPTVQEFLMHANRKSFSKLVTGFIEKNSNHLDPYINSPKEAIAKTRNGDKVPDRRQWEKVSEYVIENAEWVKRNAGKPIFVEHIASKVGSQAAAAFCQFVAGRGQGVNVRLILEEGDGKQLKALSELSPVDQNALNGVVRAAFGAWMTEGKKRTKADWDKWSANLYRYLNAMHEESAMNLFSVCIEDEWLGKAFLHSPDLEAMHTNMLDAIVSKASEPEMTAAERLKQVALQWSVKDPALFGAWCLLDVREAGIETCRLNVQGTTPAFEYNPAFIDAMSDMFLETVMSVETLRLLFGHCTQRLLHPPEAAGLASDLTITENLLSGHSDLHGLQKLNTHDKYPVLRKQTYYEAWFAEIAESKELSARWEGKTDRVREQGEDRDFFDYKRDGESQGGVIKHIGEIGAFTDDGCAKASNDACAEKAEKWHQNNALRNIVKTYAENLTMKQWGSITGHMREAVLAAYASKVDPIDLLRRFDKLVLQPKMMETWRRPNRRYDLDAPGRQRTRRARVLCGCDVSGSMSPEDIAQCLGVINAVIDHAEVDYIAWDADVFEPAIRNSGKMRIDYGHGGGGTSCQKFIDYAAKKKYNGCIALTDGIFPPINPPNATMKIAFVLTKEPDAEMERNFLNAGQIFLLDAESRHMA